MICIITITLITVYFGIDIRTVGDMGQLPTTLPIFLIPHILLNLDTLIIITPYAITMAFVGLLESLMTANILDNLTDTSSDKHQECIGQGIANITTGFMGGMAGCAMIGQSMINVKSGGRGRFSTFFAGVFLLVLVIFISDWLRVIPMAALVAVMIMVSITTFNWQSVLNFKKNSRSSNIVMLATVTVILCTHNLALGVLMGVILSALFFVKKLEKQVFVESQVTDKETRTYYIHGHLFFSSSNQLIDLFNYKEDQIKYIILDFSNAEIWDCSSLHSLDLIFSNFRKNGIFLTVNGLNSKILENFKKYKTKIT